MYSVESSVVTAHYLSMLSSLIMGSSFKKAIFEDNVSENIVNWAQNARRRKGKNKTNNDVAVTSTDGGGAVVQMMNA
ncbi:hypothetical protein ACP4OV_006981 [Aristida adscensionis]